MIKNAFNKNISIIRLIVIILMLVAVVISGTFAWLTYSSKQTALVLTIGDINDTQIKLSPYQVNGSILPSTTYSSGVSSNIEIYKGNNDRTSFALFYKINQLDLVLINKGLSYTVVDTMGTEDVSDDTVVKNSSFKALLGGNVTVVPDVIMVFDSSIDANITAGMTTNYKIYLWVDSSMGSQQEIQGTSLDMELNASIGSVKLVGDPVIGTTISTVIKDSVVDDTITYTYQWYTSNTSVTTNGEIIEGATEPSIVVSEQYEGKYLYVVVTSSKGRILSAVTSTYAQNDYVNPVVTIGTLSGTDVSLEYSDGIGVTKYYFGTSDPSTTSVTWTDMDSSKNGNINGTVGDAGKYYFAVQDGSGNQGSGSFDLAVASFYYYNGSAQTTALDRCIIYTNFNSCEFTVPSDVTSSVGPNDSVYLGVSATTSNNILTSTYGSDKLDYYAVYEGSWTATYAKGNGVNIIGSTGNSCVNYKTTNGTIYSSTTCNITLPTINADSGFSALGWFDSSDTKVGDAGGSFVLATNDTFTAKAKQLVASEVSYNNANTGVGCSDVSCMLDFLYEGVNSPSTSTASLSLGDYVSYTPIKTSYTTSSAVTGYSSNQTINPSELNLWRVLNINSDGTIDLISEYTSSTNVYFSGSPGYENLVGYLNVLASQYETSGITVGSRHFGYNGQIEFISDASFSGSTVQSDCYTGESCAGTEASGYGDILYMKDYRQVLKVLNTLNSYKVNTTKISTYWIASRVYRRVYCSSCLSSEDVTVHWSGRIIGPNGYNSQTELVAYSAYYTFSGTTSTRRFGLHGSTSRYAIRPIVTLRSDLSFSGAGTSSSPWTIN